MISEDESALWRLAVASPPVTGALDVYLDWLLTHDPVRGALLQKRMQNRELSAVDRVNEQTAWSAALGLDGACDSVELDPLPRSVTTDRIVPDPVLDLLRSLDVQRKTAVETFLTWLERDVPSVHASLAPPATAAALEALVQTCGPLPATFLELYRAHDGQTGEDVHFVPYYYLAGVDEVVASWEDHQIHEELDWKPEWIPFARFDCDYLCLDAKSGRVLEYFLKFPDRPVIANSFGEFLRRIQTSFQAANFVVTEDGLGQDPEAELSWTAMWERACRSPRKKSASRKTKPRRKSPPHEQAKPRKKSKRSKPKRQK